MTMRFNPRTFLIAMFAFLISGPAALWALIKQSRQIVVGRPPDRLPRDRPSEDDD